VHDFVGGWFRHTTGDTRGYVYADDLVLPFLYRRELLERLRGRTAAYYESSLDHLHSSGGAPLFAGHEVRLVGGMQSFEFYASRPDAGGAAGQCDAMRGIARFVEERLAEIPAGLFDSYSAGVYVARLGGERGEMIAGLAAGSDVYCEECPEAHDTPGRRTSPGGDAGVGWRHGASARHL
jgi:hypothetical protein